MKIHHLYTEQRLKEAEKFIRALMKSAEHYGSQFSAEVFVDCESFLRESPKWPRRSLVVVTKASQRRAARVALERLRELSRLKADQRLLDLQEDLARRGFNPRMNYHPEHGFICWEWGGRRFETFRAALTAAAEELA